MEAIVVKVREVGTGVVITLPEGLMRKMNLDVGDYVEIKMLNLTTLRVAKV